MNISMMTKLIKYLILTGLLALGKNQENDWSNKWSSNNPEITRFKIRSHIENRYARTYLATEQMNTGINVLDAVFSFEVPKTAFVTSFYMMIDNNEYKGEIQEISNEKKSRISSKKILDNIEYFNKRLAETNNFAVSTPLEPNQKVEFNLVYEELLVRKFDHYNHVLHLIPSQIIEDFTVDVDIAESRQITFLKVKEYQCNDSNSVDLNDENRASITKSTDNSAWVNYKPTVDYQSDISEHGLCGQFVVQYDIMRELDAGEVRIKKGYFVHFFSPVGLPAIPKHIFFILDSSLSMEGHKIQQLKSAMTSIIENLPSHDLFNIINFSSGLQYWSPDKMIPASDTNKASAKAFIERMSAKGSANFNDAIVRGLEQLTKSRVLAVESETRAYVMIFLTDSAASSGITDSERILSNIREENVNQASIYCIGIGKKVDITFIEKLAGQNRGIAYLSNDEELEIQLSALYEEVMSAVLSRVRFGYSPDAVESHTLTDTFVPLYFQGSEVIIAGKMRKGVSKLTSIIHADALSGHMEFNAKQSTKSQRGISGSTDSDLPKRIWAFLYINSLLDIMLSSTNSTAKSESKKKVISLSIEFSFVTPVTNMIISCPNEPPASFSTVAQKKEKMTNKRKGKKQGGRRDYKNILRENHKFKNKPFVDNDPHFIVPVDGLNESLCFDIDGKPGDVFQLIYDPVSAVIVNGVIIGKRPKSDNEKVRTYFGAIRIMAPVANVTVSPKVIRINKYNFSWKKSVKIDVNGAYVSIYCNRNVSVELADGFNFTILLHTVKKPHPSKVDYLGFYVEDGFLLSKETHGLIGQFQHQKIHRFWRWNTSDGREMSALILKGPHNHVSRKVHSKLISRRNMEINEQIPCWHISNLGIGALLGTVENYLVSSLYFRGSSFASNVISRTL